MIFEGSRYENTPMPSLEVEEGEFRQTLFEEPPYRVDFVSDTYRTVEGDRIDSLAFDAYGDPTLWWVIAYANPEILVWDPLEPGTEVRVPHGSLLR